MSDPYPPTISSLAIDLHRESLKLADILEQESRLRAASGNCSRETERLRSLLTHEMRRQGKREALIIGTDGIGMEALIAHIETTGPMDGLARVFAINPEKP